MAGLKIVVPTTFTDATLPVLRSDSILAPGSLFLVDASHSAGGLGTGVPALNATIPNIAWQECAAVLGSGDATTLSAIYQVGQSASAYTATDGLMERSGKGGLHSIYKQDGQATAGKGTRISVPASLKTYLRTNTSRSLYISIWGRLTRATILTGGNSAPIPYGAMCKITASTINYKAIMNGGLSISAQIGGSLGTYQSDTNNVPSTSFLRAAGSSSYAGTPSTTDGDYMSDLAMFGTWGAWSGFNDDKAPSWIFYRAYVEDLTTSGRTFAQVLALDQALYTSAFASGGKFNADTFTDPATIP